MTELFRREALHHATGGRLEGSVILATPVGFRLLSALAILVVALLVVFLLTASYARKETVPGWVTPAGGMVRITARQGGVLERVHVREGQVVAVGDPVAALRLSSDIRTGDASIALRRALDAEVTASLRRADAARAALAAERARLVDRQTSLRVELAEVEQRLLLQQSQVEILQSEVVRSQQLVAQGYLPSRELEQRRVQALSSSQALSEIRSARLTLQRDLSDGSARLREIPIELDRVEADAQTAAATLDQRATEAESRSSYIVTSPVAGRVAALPLSGGQSVEAGGVLGVVVPGDADLQAELFAPSRAAGFLRPGQEVRLQYQAFPYQKFGVGHGTVISVSRAIVAPEDAGMPGLRDGEPVVRVRVRLSRTTVPAYGANVALQPGMQLSADVIIDRRNLMEWLLDPLYAAGRR